jgi:hypothetical protein
VSDSRFNGPGTRQIQFKAISVLQLWLMACGLDLILFAASTTRLCLRLHRKHPRSGTLLLLGNDNRFQAHFRHTEFVALLKLGAFQAVIPFLDVRREPAGRANNAHPTRTIKFKRKHLADGRLVVAEMQCVGKHRPVALFVDLTFHNSSPCFEVGFNMTAADMLVPVVLKVYQTQAILGVTGRR